MFRHIKKYCSRYHSTFYLWLGPLWGGVKKRGERSAGYQFRVRTEIKILRKLLYCQEVHTIRTDHTHDTYCTVNSLPTILVSQNDPSCICRRQYNKFILASYFSRPISLENSRNLLIRSFFTLRRYRTFRNLPSKIVLYSIYIIMYVHGN
jgi:hypothetical protein